jgi:hypothetical protein
MTQAFRVGSHVPTDVPVPGDVVQVIGTAPYTTDYVPQVPGSQGVPGPVGPQGVPGPQGPAGLQGAQGFTGPIGPIGPMGHAGPAGPAGPTGLPGGGGIADAPIDGVSYARLNGAWTNLIDAGPF